MEGPNSLEGNKPITDTSIVSNNILPSINQFKFIKTNPELVKINSKPFIYSISFYSLLLLPIIIIIIIVGFFKSNKITSSERAEHNSRRTNKLARKYLSEAKKNLDKKDLFYVSLEKALHNFLKSKLSIETSDYSKHRISELLVEKNVDKESKQLFITLIENCEYARYTPASNVTINKDYKNAVKVISELDKVI